MDMSLYDIEAAERQESCFAQKGLSPKSQPNGNVIGIMLNKYGTVLQEYPVLYGRAISYRVKGVYAPFATALRCPELTFTLGILFFLKEVA